MASRELQGPTKYIVEHPGVYALSLSLAGTAVGMFAARAAKSRGLKRLGWVLLLILESIIFVGIFRLRADDWGRCRATRP